MDNIGVFAGAVGCGVFHTEFLGEHLVNLDSNKGVFFAMNVLDLNIQLWTVEGGLSDANRIVNAEMIKYSGHYILGLIPLLWGADIFITIVRIPLRESVENVFGETDCFKHVIGKLDAAAEFLLKLLGSADQVTLRNGKLTQADKTVHFSRFFVAEQGRCFSETHRQVSVGAYAIEENLILEGAGHGTQGKNVGAIVGGVSYYKHAVSIVIPMPGKLVEIAFCHEGCLGQQIAAALLLVLDKALQDLYNPCAFWQKDGEPLSYDVSCRKIFKLSSDFVVVSLFRLLKSAQMGFKLGLCGKGDAINTLDRKSVV